MLLEGEYSVDGGEFMPYDNEVPIDNHFHTITFKGRIPENILTYYEEISFSTKNLWYKWSIASGEVIMEHKYQTLDEMCEELFPVIFDETVLPKRVNKTDGEDFHCFGTPFLVFLGKSVCTE